MIGMGVPQNCSEIYRNIGRFVHIIFIYSIDFLKQSEHIWERHKGFYDVHAKGNGNIIIIFTSILAAPIDVQALPVME
jgi:hypothetical protein